VYRLGRNIEGIKAHRERMLEMAKKGFSCATELANNIVRKYDIDYRTAHDIVNIFVHEAIDERKNAEEVDSAMLDRAAMKCYGEKLNMPNDLLRLSLDPVNFVESHNSQGGVNPGEVARMIHEREKMINAVSQRHLDRAMRLKNAQSRLKLEIEKIIDGTAI
jgi:argininosuccinate lyase